MDETIEVEAHLYNLENSWTSVFNVWLLLQSDEHLIVECFDKSLYYSVNQLIIKAVKNDYYFKALRTNQKCSQELLFISAIFLTNGISHWLKQLLLENNFHELAERFYEMDYYDVHQGSPEEIKQFFTD
ncbi:MAG: hypothetical protein ABS949_06115 [Solibacillus sp.]